MSRPAPYPADTKAKGWRFELDYERIDQSGTWALAAQAGQEARPLLLMQWLVAWRQEPCGSLPSDEEVIAALIGVNFKTWAKYRKVLMRGWWLADDGLLYHPTITARVLEMLDYRRKTAERVAKHKAAMREKQLGNALPTESLTVKNDTGTGTGTGTNINTNTPQPPEGADGRFAEFWETWPKSLRKGGKAECLKAWNRHKLESQADAILAHVKAMSESPDWLKDGGAYIPAPVVYLRGKRWDGTDLLEHTDSVFAGGV